MGLQDVGGGYTDGRMFDWTGLQMEISGFGAIRKEGGGLLERGLREEF